MKDRWWKVERLEYELAWDKVSAPHPYGACLHTYLPVPIGSPPGPRTPETTGS